MMAFACSRLKARIAFSVHVVESARVEPVREARNVADQRPGVEGAKACKGPATAGRAGCTMTPAAPASTSRLRRWRRMVPASRQSARPVGRFARAPVRAVALLGLLLVSGAAGAEDLSLL